LPGARARLFPCAQDSAGPLSLYRETEGMPHGFGFHQLVEGVLVMRGSFEERALFVGRELADAVSEQQG
jgi:hypothetical protein